MLSALRRAVGKEVRDLEVQLSPPAKALLAAGGRLYGGPWKYSPAYEATLARRVRRRVSTLSPGVVLEIADLVVPTVAPTLVYQDMNFDVAAAHADLVGPNNVSTFPTTTDHLQELAARQTERYADLEGVIAASAWYAEWLVKRCGLDQSAVHVVRPGINNPPSRARREVEPERARVLFVGGEFHRKGGEVLVEAARRARARVPNLELTIAGPRRLDLPADEWIHWLGVVDPAAVSALYYEHDLFVLPSLFEAFGIALLEARAAGLPCIAADHMAMPELVSPRASRLVPVGEVDPLADAIVELIEDVDARQAAIAEASAALEAWSWDRAADEILGVVRAIRA